MTDAQGHCIPPATRGIDEGIVIKPYNLRQLVTVGSDNGVKGLSEKHTMKFCKRHKEECDRAISSGPKAILKFWVRANGGPEKLTKRILYGDKSKEKGKEDD
jgi:hypothetical protein